MYITSLVLLFILRLRFPVNKSLFSIIRHRYGNDVVDSIRKFERTDFRTRKTELDLKFLSHCKDHDLFPHFLQFRLANRHLKDSGAYLACKQRLLNEEIRLKRCALRRSEGQMENVRTNLQNLLSCFDFIHVITQLVKLNTRSLERVEEIHQRKWNQLQLEQSKCRNDPDKVIYNLSSVQLTDLQKSVLAKGLNFALPPRELKYCDYLLPFELLHRDISRLPVSHGEHLAVKARLKDIALSSFYNYNSRQISGNLTKAEKEALHSLKAIKDIVIHKSDKGNSVVILDKADYNRKMMDILTDTTKFQSVRLANGKEFNLIINKEKKITLFINNLIKQGKISQEVGKKLIPTGSRPGILYGLTKVHKDNCPERPILSAIGTTGYEIAKFLVHILEPITTNQYTVKDSFQFAKEIASVKSDNLVMASIDVQSLFTNIPLNETIQICLDSIFQSQSHVSGLDRNDLEILLGFAVKGMVFQFDSKLFEQIDGVAMGSPLGPTLANAFLAHYEQKWLAECPRDFKPYLYRRYVDDSFLLFQNGAQLTDFRSYLNTKHVNMQFTSEIEADDKLAFLDVLVERIGDKFVTSIYRKPTFSGVYTNFKSYLPIDYKYGLVYTLIHRAYTISSNFAKMHNDFVTLRAILQRNGYGSSLVDNCIDKFFGKVYNLRTPVVTVPKKPIFICLPFLGRTSLQVRSRILTLIKRTFPQVDCRVVFRSPFRLFNLFPFKDRVSECFRSGVVYQFKCSSCYATYYGKSKRHLHTRVCEHLGISSLTGKLLSKVNESAVSQHKRDTGHQISFNDFSVLSHDTNDFFLLIKESLLISRDKPALNNNVSSIPLSLF